MLTALLAQDPAPAGGAGGAGGPGGSPFSNPMFLMLGLFLLFWIVVILPMSRRQRKEQEKVLASISRGTKILTRSGIIGTVVTIKDGEDEVVIRSDESKLRISRAAIERVLGTDAAEAAAK